MREGDECDEQEVKGRGSSMAFKFATEWFEAFMNNADRMPNTQTRNLPSCLTKAAVYLIYRDQTNGKPHIARSTFLYNMWKRHFPDVVIPKVSRNMNCKKFRRCSD